MSEAQGTASGATAQATSTHAESTKSAHQSGSTQEAKQVSGNQATPAGQPQGKSATGAADNADKAAQAIQQGRELSTKELAIPVTRIVNGQKVTRPIGEWINVSQLEQASHQRFQQAQVLAKQAQQLIWIAQNDPAQFMKITGKDPNEFSQQQLASWLEEQQLSESEKELKRYKAKEKEDQDRTKQEAAQKQQAEAQAKDTADYNHMVKESLDAWKDSGLPDDPYWGQRMAAEVARHQSQGIPLTWKEAAAIVKHDWITSTQRILDSFQNVEELANHLGEKVLKKLREFEITRITSKQASRQISSQQKRPGQSPVSQKEGQPQFVNEKDYNDRWKKLGYSG